MPADRVGGLEQLRLVEDREVGRVGGGEVVAGAEQGRDARPGPRPSAPGPRRSRRSCARRRPETKYLWTMPIGTMTWSSGSWNPAPPLGWRMPISWNGRPPIVIWLPMALASSLRSSAVVAPEHRDPQVLLDRGVGQERSPARRRRRARRRSRRRCRRSRSSSSRRRRRPRPGSWTRGRRRPRRRSRAVASASPVVSVELAPPFAPAAEIVSRFVPRLDRRWVMFDVVPCPTPTSATTDATPMITPSIVRAARRRPVRRRENASRISSRILTPRAARRGCAPGGWPRRRPRRRG